MNHPILFVAALLACGLAGWGVREYEAREEFRLITLVLNALSIEPDRSALEICAAINRPSGMIHPTLAMLERAGLVTSKWEADVPTGVPARRLYRLVRR